MRRWQEQVPPDLCDRDDHREDVLLTELSVIEGAYLRDLLDQPESLSATLASLHDPKPLRQIAAKLRRGKFRSIVLTGMGSSFHALHPINIDLINHGLVAMMVETSELVHYKRQLFDPKTLIIAVSQSGQSVEMVRLLQINRGKSTIVALTNTADSPLARNADATLLTQAGNEFSVSCKTYVTALMALRWLTDLLCECDLRRTHRELEEASPLVRNYLSNWKDHVQTLAKLLAGTRHLFLVGRGSSLAAVGTGALVVKESDHFHAEGMSSAAFRHGPFEMLGEEIFVLVFAGDGKTRDLNRRLVEDIREQRGRTELVGEDIEYASLRLPSGPATIHPILEILPVQMITLALAAQAGREPGRFELATKVTTRE
jgi:glutamine---fructose-6-phosphate transaminase (isomerizing)